MIKTWLFEFVHAPEDPGLDVDPGRTARNIALGLDRWKSCEALGFEGIFFSEHHFGHSFSSSPNLYIAAIAHQTTTLRLGTMGMVLPFYQPWRVLEEIGILDQLCGGRLEIGCASGVPQELAKVGLDMTEARERYEEMLEIIDAGLAAPVVTHRGKYWSCENLKILPRPIQQPPPKWTTVVSDASARRSARRRSKICTAFHSVARTIEVFDAYRDEADRCGFAVGPDHLALRRNVSVARTESEAREMYARSREITDKLRADDPRIRSAPKTLLDAPAGPVDKGGFIVHDDDYVTGTPAQVVEQIVEQFRATGAGHFVAIVGRGIDDEDGALHALFGREVVPALRRANLPGLQGR